MTWSRIILPVSVRQNEMASAMFCGGTHPEKSAPGMAFRFASVSIVDGTITVAVTFLTLAEFLITYLGVKYLHNSIGYLLVFAMQAILFFNAFIPHLRSTIHFRMYSPGVVTAVLITILFSIYLFQRALCQEILNWRQIWILLGIAPFAMVLFAYIALQIGRIFDKSGAGKTS